MLNDICKPCARRHHNECKDDGCACGCPKTLMLTGLSLTGYVVAPGTSFERWKRDMTTLCAVDRVAPWAIGDGYNYARSQGKEFEEQALQVFSGYAEQTVYNYAVVAALFPPEKRHTGKLTIRHCATVAKLARQDMAKAQALLDEAEQRDWSTKALGEELAAREALPARGEVESPKTTADQGSDWRDLLLADIAGTVRTILEEQFATENTQAVLLRWLKEYAEKIAERA